MVGGRGWGHFGIRGVQPEATGAHPVPGAQERNFKTSALAQSSLTRPAGRVRAGCPVREPKAQRLGRLPSRSQEAGLAGEQRKDRWGEEEKVPGHPCGATPPVEPRPGCHTPRRTTPCGPRPR